MDFVTSSLIDVYNDLKHKITTVTALMYLGNGVKQYLVANFLKVGKAKSTLPKLIMTHTLAIWLSFDENVNPYFPCGIFQISDDNQIRLIDYCAKNLITPLKSWAAVLTKLRKWQHKGLFTFVG